MLASSESGASLPSDIDLVKIERDGNEYGVGHNQCEGYLVYDPSKQRFLSSAHIRFFVSKENKEYPFERKIIKKFLTPSSDLPFPSCVRTLVSYLYKSQDPCRLSSKKGLSGIPSPNYDRNGWMFFAPSQIPSVQSLCGVYSLFWRFGDDSHEKWTDRFNSFKFRCRSSHFFGFKNILVSVFEDLLAQIPTPPSRVGIVSALGHGDCKATSKSKLVLLSRALVDHHGIVDLTEKISKRPHKALHKQSCIEDREDEIRGKYDSKSIPGFIDVILILDDLATRGATLEEISRSISSAGFDGMVIGVTLAKNEKRSFALTKEVVLNNNHVPAFWDQLWSLKKGIARDE